MGFLRFLLGYLSNLAFVAAGVALIALVLGRPPEAVALVLLSSVGVGVVLRAARLLLGRPGRRVNHVKPE